MASEFQREEWNFKSAGAVRRVRAEQEILSTRAILREIDNIPLEFCSIALYIYHQPLGVRRTSDAEITP